MPAGGNPRRSPPDAAQLPTFTVEHFGWGAPDRLVVTGTFSGLEPQSPADAVLTVFGEDGAHRLPAIDGDDAPQVDGDRLTASFAWLETPVAFQHARLELGGSLAVDLADPEAAAGGDPLPVQMLEPPEELDAHDELDPHDEIDALDDEPPAAVEAPRRAADVDGAADRLRLETQLLEATEQLEDARATAREAEEALHRAQADLAAERERRAADAERFREGLAMVRGSAEEALAAATEARAEAEEQVRNEITMLRERIAELEPASAERDAARAELARAHEELDGARGALDATRERAQELLDGLSDAAAGRR
jgi:hypothetical protein